MKHIEKQQLFASKKWNLAVTYVLRSSFM